MSRQCEFPTSLDVDIWSVLSWVVYWPKSNLYPMSWVDVKPTSEVDVKPKLEADVKETLGFDINPIFKINQNPMVIQHLFDVKPTSIANWEASPNHQNCILSTINITIKLSNAFCRWCGPCWWNVCIVEKQIYFNWTIIYAAVGYRRNSILVLALILSSREEQYDRRMRKPCCSTVLTKVFLKLFYCAFPTSVISKIRPSSIFLYSHPSHVYA